ncbi:hypothetical protein SNEBB_001462 [Seison nebaliae]|nr:hypothetical protein SNEBB_001462 [Seison nebaliae]
MYWEFQESIADEFQDPYIEYPCDMSTSKPDMVAKPGENSVPLLKKSKRNKAAPIKIANATGMLAEIQRKRDEMELIRQHQSMDDDTQSSKSRTSSGGAAKSKQGVTYLSTNDQEDNKKKVDAEKLKRKVSAVPDQYQFEEDRTEINDESWWKGTAEEVNHGELPPDLKEDVERERVVREKEKAKVQEEKKLEQEKAERLRHAQQEEEEKKRKKEELERQLEELQKEEEAKINERKAKEAEEFKRFQEEKEKENELQRHAEEKMNEEKRKNFELEKQQTIQDQENLREEVEQLQKEEMEEKLKRNEMRQPSSNPKPPKEDKPIHIASAKSDLRIPSANTMLSNTNSSNEKRVAKGIASIKKSMGKYRFS